MSENIVSLDISILCSAIYKASHLLDIIVPATADECGNVANGFSYQWNFLLCIGAHDGKRVFRNQPILFLNAMITKVTIQLLRLKK